MQTNYLNNNNSATLSLGFRTKQQLTSVAMVSLFR